MVTELFHSMFATKFSSSNFFATNIIVALSSRKGSRTIKSEWFVAQICGRNSEYVLGVQNAELHLTTLDSCGVNGLWVSILAVKRAVLSFFNNLCTSSMNAWYGSKNVLMERLKRRLAHHGNGLSTLLANTLLTFAFLSLIATTPSNFLRWTSNALETYNKSSVASCVSSFLKGEDPAGLVYIQLHNQKLIL